MLVDVFPVGPIQANCVLLGDEEAGELAVIDPGGDAAAILARVAAAGLTPVMILHTHGHLDHAGATAEVKRALGDGVRVGLHPEGLDLYSRLADQGRAFGLEVESPPPPDLWLEHGTCLAVGDLGLEVRHTPGHSPGGVVFVVHDGPESLVVAGDVLFAGSIGRTDLWGGSFERLAASIREQLYTLPDDTRVICGHGPDTTIGRERATNPFVSG